MDLAPVDPELVKKIQLRRQQVMTEIREMAKRMVGHEATNEEMEAYFRKADEIPPPADSCTLPGYLERYPLT
jgi:hypothetical protein